MKRQGQTGKKAEKKVKTGNETKADIKTLRDGCTYRYTLEKTIRQRQRQRQRRVNERKAERDLK